MEVHRGIRPLQCENEFAPHQDRRVGGFADSHVEQRDRLSAVARHSYPSIHERMRFSAAVMRHLGFEDDAATFLKEWHHTYPATVAEDPSQTNEIANHLFGGDNAGDPPGLVLAAAGRPRALRDVIRLSRANQQAVLVQRLSRTQPAHRHCCWQP